MNKRAAKEKAEAGGYTFGDLLKLVSEMPESDAPSLVNPALTKAHSKKIYMGFLEGRSPEEEIKPFRYNIRTGRSDARTGDSLGAQNIFRECL